MTKEELEKEIGLLQALLAEVVEHIDEWNFPITLGDRIRLALEVT